MYKSIRKLVVLMQIAVVEILFQDSLYDSGAFFFFLTVSSFFFQPFQAFSFLQMLYQRILST